MAPKPTRRRSLTLAPLSIYLTLCAAFVQSPSFRLRGDSIARRHRASCCSSRGSGCWELRSSLGANGERNVGEGSEDEDASTYSFPDTLGQSAPVGVSPEKWERVLRSARETTLLSPNPEHPPSHVAAVTLQALRRTDVPYTNFGCEIAIRFSSTSNPASGFTPGGMRTYIDDPSMPFYRVLSDWDEMAPVGGAEIDVADPARANQQVRVRKEGDLAWSTVSMDFVKEDGCWLIERLWIDDKSVAGGRAGGGREVSPPPQATLSVAELFDEDRLEMMSCKYADYDPACLAAAGGGDWLEERPNPSLSPKAVALTCILSLRQNDDGSGSDATTDDSRGDGEVAGGDAAATAGAGAKATKPRLNEGCERVIRFCSPTNVASTLTPAHFAQYLKEPWYAIFNQWDELSFHSEDISEDESTADLVVLLRPDNEEAWTSVNWELVKCDGVWLTERIWVVDV
ncbi:unnamed protein product [Ectocarpus sp. 8 AP-2014]